MSVWVNNPAHQGVFMGLYSAFLRMVKIVIVLVIIKNRTVIEKIICVIGRNRTASELSGIFRTSYLLIGQPFTGGSIETEQSTVCYLRDFFHAAKDLLSK
jgi:hypothetical protein